MSPHTSITLFEENAERFGVVKSEVMEVYDHVSYFELPKHLKQSKQLPIFVTERQRRITPNSGTNLISVKEVAIEPAKSDQPEIIVEEARTSDQIKTEVCSNQSDTKNDEEMI